MFIKCTWNITFKQKAHAWTYIYVYFVFEECDCRGCCLHIERVIATVHFHVYLDSSLVDSSSLNNTLNRGKELYLKIYIELRRTEKYIESSWNH